MMTSQEDFSPENEYDQYRKSMRSATLQPIAEIKYAATENKNRVVNREQIKFKNDSTTIN